jgi:hypothetical protein
LRSVKIDRDVRELVESGVASGDFDTPNPRMAAVALLSLDIDLTRWYREDGRRRPGDLAAGGAVAEPTFSDGSWRGPPTTH